MIKDSGEYVINIPSVSLVKVVNYIYSDATFGMEV